MNVKRKPVVLDLFAGAGGISQGFRSAGFNVKGHLEFDKHACETLRKNFRGSVVIEQDISKVNPLAIQEQIGQIDVIIGGPPCQGFSLVGKGKLRSLGVHDDPRNKMYKQFLRFVNALQPTAIVMENVPAILKHDQGRTAQRIKSHFEAIGYDVTVMLLNAADYGVPQTRKRAFFVGIRSDLNRQFDPPKKTRHNPEENTRHKKKWVTVGEAILDLPSVAAGEDKSDSMYTLGPKSKYQKRMRGGSNRIRNHIARPYGEMDMKIFSIMHQGMKYHQIPDELKRYRDDCFKDKYKRLVEDSPSWTVVAHLAKDGYMYIHPTQDRTITPREAARLQSFPDKFVFSGPMTQQFKQIGNAVPPLLGQAIGKALLQALRNQRRVMLAEIVSN